MVQDYDDYATSNKKICSACIDEPYLQKIIEDTKTVSDCSYCNAGKVPIMYMGDLANRVDHVFDRYYQRTNPDPVGYQITLLSDKESSYEFERDGDPIVDCIQIVARLDHEPATDIQDILDYRYRNYEYDCMGEETEYCGASYYSEIPVDDAMWLEEWKNLENHIKTKARFMSSKIEKILDEVFCDLREMRTKDGASIILSVDPQCSFHRARVFQDKGTMIEALENPVEQLGPPPKGQSRSGRMNAHGISVFYGSSSPETAIAEVRPSVGSFVVTAVFEPVRELNLLNLSALEEVAEPEGSVFDENYFAKLQKAKFIKRLSNLIAKPVTPDHELLEYTTTQIISEYLADNIEFNLDGILFKPAQNNNDDLNVILFHTSSKVQNLDLENYRIEAINDWSHEEEPESFSLLLHENIADQNSKNIRPLEMLKPEPKKESKDSRLDSLKLKLETITIHEIQGVHTIHTSQNITIYEQDKEHINIYNI